MVPEGPHVRAVYLNMEHGILAADSIDGKLLIDCSTIDTSTSLAVANAVSEKSKSAAMYDAPRVRRVAWRRSWDLDLHGGMHRE